MRRRCRARWPRLQTPDSQVRTDQGGRGLPGRADSLRRLPRDGEDRHATRRRYWRRDGARAGGYRVPNVARLSGATPQGLSARNRDRREVRGNDQARHPEQPDEGLLRHLASLAAVRFRRADAGPGRDRHLREPRDRPEGGAVALTTEFSESEVANTQWRAFT